MRKLISNITILGALLLILGVAIQAMAAKPQPPRFVDNGDGTITDNHTGLMWEKKTADVNAFLIPCNVPSACPDPTKVNNGYKWSSTIPAPDGTLFTDFLAKMNCTISQDGICGPGAYSDWRIPTLAEYLTILDCSFNPCINPIFGPTLGAVSWSSTTFAGNPARVWLVNFGNGVVMDSGKNGSVFVRAVRGGR